MTLVRRLPPLGATSPASDLPQRGRRTAQYGRIVWRIAGAIAVTVPTALAQLAAMALPGNAKRAVPLWYWATICRVLGVHRRVIGTPVRRDGRPVLFISNHTTWLDIPTLGGTVPACFVSKAEVANWPIVNIVAWLGRTVFVSRRVRETGRERDDMRDRLAAGDNLILFPEGTSSDGARTLSFRSPFFALAEAADVRPIIQPVSLVYDRLDGLPIGRFARPITSWYGDMDLGRHFVRLARFSRVRATVLLHAPIDPAQFASRKELARAVWTVVASGAAGLRQNRAVHDTDI